MVSYSPSRLLVGKANLFVQEIWLNSFTSDPSMLETLLSKNLDADYNVWTMQHVVEVLRQSDRQNGSWTNEDPSRYNPSSMSLVSAVEAASEADIANPVMPLRLSSAGKKTEEALFQYVQTLDKGSCLATNGVATWKITAVSFDPANVSLETTVFDLEPMPLSRARKQGATKG